VVNRSVISSWYVRQSSTLPPARLAGGVELLLVLARDFTLPITNWQKLWPTYLNTSLSLVLAMVKVITDASFWKQAKLVNTTRSTEHRSSLTSLTVRCVKSGSWRHVWQFLSRVCFAINKLFKNNRLSRYYTFQSLIILINVKIV